MITIEKQDVAGTLTPFLRVKLSPAASEHDVRPLTVAKARAIFSDTVAVGRALWAFMNDLQPPDDLLALCTSVKELRDFHDAAHVVDWLREQRVSEAEPIIVSWGKEYAIATTWGRFIDLWQPWCVVGADDTFVTPLSEVWALQHHHEGAFAFALCLR